MAQAEVTRTVNVSAEKFFKAVHDVLDYPKFVDEIKKVTIVEARSENDRRVAYELSMMGKDMSYVLDVKDDPSTFDLNWTLAKSDFFKVNNGGWKIKPTGANTAEVTYSLELEFNFMVPGFILKNLVKGTLPAMVENFAKRAGKI